MNSILDSSSLIHVANGMQIGINLGVEKNSEDSIKQGKSYALSGVNQFTQISIAFADLQTVVSHVSKLATLAYTITGLMLVTLGTEIAAVVDHYDQDFFGRKIEQYAGKGVNNFLKTKIYPFFRENGGNLAHVMATTTAVAKCALGLEKEGAATLLFLTIGYLDRKGYLPERVSRFYNKQMVVIAQVAGFILGSPFVKVIRAIQLSVVILPYLLNKIKYPADARMCHYMASQGILYPSLQEVDYRPGMQVKKAPPLTCNQILSFIDREDDKPLYVNPSHVSVRPNLKVDAKNVEYQTLLSLFDSIEWNQSHLNALIANIEQDERYLSEKKEKRALVSSEDYRQWSRAQLVNFVDNISGKKRPKGSLEGIELLRDDTRFCIKHLTDLSEKLKAERKGSPEAQAIQNELTDMILTFSIEGGDYCVAAMRRVVKQVKTSILATQHSEGIDLEGRISYALAHRRQQIAENVANQMFRKNPFVAKAVQADIHYINAGMVAFMNGLGVDMEHVEQDNAVEQAPILQAIITVAVPFFRASFWQHAYPKELDKSIFYWLKKEEGPDQAPPGAGLFAKTKLFFRNVSKLYFGSFHDIKAVFAADYSINAITDTFDNLLKQKAISNQELIGWWDKHLINFNEEEQEAIREAMADGMFTLCEDGTSQVSKQWLQIMLVEMGILKF